MGFRAGSTFSTFSESRYAGYGKRKNNSESNIPSACIMLSCTGKPFGNCFIKLQQ
jgi:hypothetical protein